MMTFLAVALKGALVLLLAALVVRLLRQAPASARHGVWAAAFAALLLLPLLEGVGPNWAIGVLPSGPPVTQMGAPPALPIPPIPPAPPAPMALAPNTPAAPALFGSVTEADAHVAAHEAEVNAHAAEVEAHMADFEATMADFEADMAAFEGEMAAFEGAIAMADMEWVGAESASPWPVVMSRSLSPLGRWLVGLWGLGALIVALGWLGATLAAYRIVATAQEETDDEWAVLAEHARRMSGIEGPVRLLRTDALDVPVAWGYGRPAVVLPASADEWDDGRREAVLLHEMAHLRRRDAWTQAVAQLAVAIHWVNPLAWWGYRRFLAAREHACDDAVLQGGARPSDYAAHLVGVARSLRRDPYALAAVAPMARCAPIEDRIVSILDDQRRRGRIGRVSQTVTVLLAAGILLPLAALQPVARPHTEAVTPTDLPVFSVSDEAMEPWPAAMAPAVADTDSVAVEWMDDEWENEADWDEDLADAERDIDQARRDIRRTLEQLDREDNVASALQSDALRAAEAALADIDVAAIRREAMEAATSARRISLDWSELHRIQEDALREAEKALEEIDWDEVEFEFDEDREEVRDALEEARKDLQDARRDARQDARREARRSRSSGSSARVIRLQSTEGDRKVRVTARTATPTPQPAPSAPSWSSPRPTASPAIPWPPAAPAPSASRADTSSCDWDAIDRARARATRRAPTSW